MKTRKRKKIQSKMSAFFEQNRSTFNNVITWLGLIVLTAYAWVDYKEGDMIRAVMNILLLISLIVTSIYSRRTKSTRAFLWFISIAFFLVSIMDYLDSGTEFTSHYWALLAPSIIYLVIGFADGTVLVFSLFMVFLGLQISSDFGVMNLPYTSVQNYIFLVVFSISGLISGSFEYITEKAQKDVYKKGAELAVAKEELEKDYKEKSLFTKKLDKHLKSLKEKNRILEDTESAILNILEDVEEERINTKAEKERLNTIIQSIGDGVLVLDRNRDIVMINESTELITGFNEKDLLGNKLREVIKFIDTKGEDSDYAFIDDVFKTGTITQIAKGTSLITKDGEKIPVGDSSSPIKDDKGNVLGCVVVFRDISKEREIDRMKSEFVSISSHQLRTPLTGIRWYLELLRDTDYDKLTEDQREFFERIEESNTRMIKLVEDLLNVSRIETGRKFSIEKVPSDVVKLVYDNIEAQAIHAQKKNIKVEVDKSMPKELQLTVDPDKISQVIKNLINNAIKYSPEKTKITIGYKAKGKEHIFSVKDQGAGIPKKDQKNIFQKFFRADNIKKMQVEGSGLGLYIIQAIIEGHGGKVWFESKVNKGSTFYFSLK